MNNSSTSSEIRPAEFQEPRQFGAGGFLHVLFRRQVPLQREQPDADQDSPVPKQHVQNHCGNSGQETPCAWTASAPVKNNWKDRTLQCLSFCLASLVLLQLLLQAEPLLIVCLLSVPRLVKCNRSATLIVCLVGASRSSFAWKR